MGCNIETLAVLYILHNAGSYEKKLAFDDKAKRSFQGSNYETRIPRTSQ